MAAISFLRVSRGAGPVVSYIQQAAQPAQAKWSQPGSHGITPIFVFYGKPFSAKLSTNADRAKQRLAAYAEAKAYLNNYNQAKAEECAKKAVAITSVMIYSEVHNFLPKFALVAFPTLWRHKRPMGRLWLVARVPIMQSTW